MAFHVEPDSLRNFSKQLGRAEADTQRALEYVQRDCSIGTFSKGPLSEIAHLWGGGHDNVVANVRSALEHLQQVVGSSKREITRSADFYEETDQSQASKMDATYPKSKR
ncbi:WXG100 family type VII secretion target [Streptomyces sp. NPDC051684]|uniref:WXG100 family type VII secretion target n=1 Tax=Streptomyces sp. NPDC051684 TaxID=3365670 RepID=UPI0037BE0351